MYFLYESCDTHGWKMFIGMPSRGRKEAIVTTSWDDGHPLDFKIAELLTKYGLKGTFYIPVRNDEHFIMDKKEIKDIASNFEIGGHTINHVDLTTIHATKVHEEILGGKKIIEDIIGKELIIFAYPRGHYNKQIMEQVKNAGFKGARSASWFHAEYPDDLYQLHPTIQVYPFPALVHIGHLIKELNVGILKRYLLHDKCISDLKTLTARWLDSILPEGGILHVWGHSWEIEELGLWKEVEAIVSYISTFKDIVHLTNGEITLLLKRS